ncbi:hypothetical protein A2973_05725 [Candidatus Gottesmanbacteria bacterium RIFCSPLOWO2_01_FULL_49_10]|uniref:Uncharacterized protein n=1 Tax=Candidatus Gottesmanbacteria bacterium RIFCSPLOWO2_01_FULL_49_10 TaxID=1798396 RepID=A0A1F6B0Y4_9BACT|nr:MAG: hypothetical protein UY10_C0013G0019 [Microgenomates group bacterium GW2011_GWA2_47_8]OGG30576.1 MAG: hypothetical protein A2973_05725 [Candidatus Gottesmanbacteria bacterium RIFCSPLOWO2_01_FULL_49_10]
MRDVKIMDIAMNLSRIGNWAADDFDGKQKRITIFLEQTNSYLRGIDITAYPKSTQEALTRFEQAFNTLRTQSPHTSEERLRWADTVLTWSNILTHKARIGE